MAKLKFYFGKNSNSPIKNLSNIFIPDVILDLTTFTGKISNKKTFKYNVKGFPNNKLYTITSKGKKLSYYKNKSSTLISITKGFIESHTVHENGKLKLKLNNFNLNMSQVYNLFEKNKKIDESTIIKNNNKMISKLYFHQNDTVIGGKGHGNDVPKLLKLFNNYMAKYFFGKNDVMKGNHGNDNLWGYGGNDKISGGSGNDFLVGGKGNDKLIGGKGKDIFKLSTGKGYDLIQDFKDKEDKIYIGSSKNLKLKNKGKDVYIYKGKDLLAKVKGAKGDLSIKGKYFV